LHELSITQSILEIVLEQARTNEANEVVRVDLVIGRLTGIVSDSVRLYFGILAEDTIARGAELRFEEIETSLRCRDCNTTFLADGDIWSCPACKGLSAEIIAGRECHVKSIVVN
jgi:hydrogenase nickel incorporation protein HypA/HybF